MLLLFAGGLAGVDKPQKSLSKGFFYYFQTLPLNYIFVLLLVNVDVIPKQNN